MKKGENMKLNKADVSSLKKKINILNQNLEEKEKEVEKITKAILSPIQNISLTDCLSFLPQYCAPRIDVAVVEVNKIIFWTNCIWVASDTAVIEFCSTLPSITASDTATNDNISAWKAIGAVSFNNLK